jgi:hypothetical protein
MTNRTPIAARPKWPFGGSRNECTHRGYEVTRLASCATFITPAILLFLFYCGLLKTTGFVSHTIRTGGEERIAPVEVPASPSEPRMIIFALDGAVPAGRMDAIKSSRIPLYQRVVGQVRGRRTLRARLRSAGSIECASLEHDRGLGVDLHR